MEKIKVIINGQSKEVFQNSNVLEILNTLFSPNSEFVVEKNSQIITGCFDRILVEEYDILNIISYSKDQSLNSKRQYRF
jgi:sulfur carrier protein ThiS